MSNSLYNTKDDLMVLTYVLRLSVSTGDTLP
jgi:hypothetical protein